MRVAPPALGLLAVLLSTVVAARCAEAKAPFPRPETLVGVGPAYPKMGRALSFREALSPAEFRDIETRSITLERVVAWDMGHRNVTGGASSERVFTAFWWGDPLATLEVAPFLGRSFAVEETAQAARVAVISHRLWQRQFAGDPAVIGKTIGVAAGGAAQESFVVVGVLAPEVLVYGTDLWLTMWAPQEHFQRGTRQIQVLARLRPGLSIEQANAELSQLAGSIESEHVAEHPEYQGWRLEARPLHLVEKESARGR